jgi:hypothetical protein
MSITVRAHYRGKSIVPDQPLALPQGQELEVDVRVVEKQAARRNRPRRRPIITDMPFFGMWAHREDMKDSVAWVNKERERWDERLTRED